MTTADRHHDGYVVDAPYIEPIAPDLQPAWISTMCVLHGQPPLDRSRPLRWMELGSGGGMGACMVAAANDDVEVWGCDVNPAHVERARSIASQVDLTQCTFEHASFAEVAADPSLGPSEVDVVVVQGVLSWISSQNQGHIAEIVRQRLRPGGVVFVSYELGTGWSSMVPIAEAMRLFADADGRRSDLVFHDAAEAMRALADGGAVCFPLGEREQVQFDGMTTADAAYGAHEYLGAHFRPMMFDEVAELFAGAGCSYLGGQWAADPLHAYWVPPELDEVVRSTADPVLRQMLRDLATQRALRGDLLRKGLAATPIAAQEARLEELTLIGLGQALGESPMVTVPLGEVSLDLDAYRPLVEALDRGTLSVRDIRAIHPEWSLSECVGAFSLLMSGGYGSPVVSGWERSGARKRARAMNRLLVRENAHGGDHRHLIAPAIGGAVGSEYVEMLTLGALWDGLPAEVDALTDHALEVLARQRRKIREEGELIEDQTTARSIVERRVGGALTRVDELFAPLGVS